MRAPRGMAASVRISTLLLGCALAWPVHAQSRHLDRTDAAARPGDSASPGLDLPAPDLPARVIIDPSDVEPGDKARAALSRIVADPGAILQAYAPVGQPRSQDPATTKKLPAPASVVRHASPMAGVGATPSSAVAAVASTPDPVITSSLPPAPAVPASPRPAPAPIVAPPASAPPAAANPLPSQGSLGGNTRTPSAPPVASGEPATADPGAEGKAAADRPALPAETPALPATESIAAVLDAGALQKAVEAYVGPDPAAGGGRVSAQQLARYKDRQAIQAAYAARSFAPLWIEDGKFNARARSALARIDHAPEDGLDLRGFAVAVPHGGDPAALAASELAMTEAVVAYGKQASGGRIDPSRIGALIAAKPDVADAARILGALAGAPDAGDALRGFNPPQKGYALLRSKLAELRQSSEVAGHDPIPYGRTLKPGMRDARVPLIRARFGLDMPSSDADQAGLVYDTKVAAAVADFQKAHHLPASGVLTIRTIAALSGGNPRRLEDDIIANMEEWRWLPRDLGQNHIEVNIPDFSVSIMHGDDVFHHARVVVGQPDKPTPVFSQTMRFIIVNPYWNVPLSIVKKEMLPKLAADPNYFGDHGYETVERNGITYVRQPPGDSNALGRIKFMFPNQYSVYLHDTNARALFGNDKRALSHGCVRVEAPFKFAEAILGRQNGWTEARVKKLIGGKERTITLPQPLPIHIVYFTAFVDQTGNLQLRGDVYGYEAKVKAALGLAS